jgi:hypothetical protein
VNQTRVGIDALFWGKILGDGPKCDSQLILNGGENAPAKVVTKAATTSETPEPTQTPLWAAKPRRMRKLCALGHVDPVGPGGQRGLSGNAIRRLLY